MEISIEKTDSNSNRLTPSEVRNILGVDNNSILELCKKGNIIPKKNSKGNTYFSKDEVNVMQRLQSLHSQSSKPAKTSTSLVEAPQLTASDEKVAKYTIENIVSSLNVIQDNLSKKLSKILDEKLDGMDEVIVELIRCKTENENLRFKINELNKENFALKNNLNTFKPFAFNLYMKKDEDKII